jgi:competence protein ComEC
MAAILGLSLLSVAWRLGLRSSFNWRRACLMGLALGLGACILALAVVNARCIQQAQHALPPTLEGQDLTLTGVVSSLPQPSAMGVRFRFEVMSAQLSETGAAVQIPKSIDLSWYDREEGGPMQGRSWDALGAGDLWRFNVRLKAPHGTLNPHGFDFELWLWEQGIMATGSVRVGKRDRAPQKIRTSWRYPIAQARQQVRQKIFQTLQSNDSPNQALAGVIAALVMGDQGAISQADWNVFRATGVAHLMSISGLHITLFAWAASAGVGLAWRSSARRGSRLCLRWPAPHAAVCMGVALATLYALFSGWGLPAQRTVIMLWMVALLRWRGASWPWLWIWGAALVAVVFWDPWALMQAGFWLSFVAVGVLVITADQADRQRTNIVDDEMTQEENSKSFRLKIVSRVWAAIVRLWREQWVVTVALLPLCILFFGQISLLGLLANLIAIPWVTWVVTPLAMMGILGPPSWHVAAWALQPLLLLLREAASWPDGVWHMPVPPTSLAVLAMAGAILWLMRWPFVIRAWGLLLMLPAIFWQLPQVPAGQFELWMADVGQGNAVIIRTAHHALLYDAGPQYSEDNDAGQRVLVPMLTAMGVQLDRIMLSHRDIDHTGGAAAVLASQKSADLWSSLEEGHPLASLRPVMRCEAGQAWVWDGVRFEVIHPLPTDYRAGTKSNALSCVLKIEAMQVGTLKTGHEASTGRALMMGDIEAPQEAALLARAALQPVDLLLVPHHGSQTSSTQALLTLLQPRWAVVQAGYRNRYGHPAPKVVARYEAQGIDLVLSPTCGAAHWRSDKPTQLTCERYIHRRYWHDRHESP